VSTAEEILTCAGTRYSYSPSVFALTDAIKQKKERIAFVGTPCQIRALRRMQTAGLKKYTAPVKFMIGLMCSECFSYDGLIQKHILGILGVKPSDIEKINIKGKMIITAKSGIQTISLPEAKQHARTGCKSCNDFSSELADISVGGLGLNEWTFTIIRTDRGEEMFSNAEEKGKLNVRDAKEETNALTLLSKLSKKKSQNLVCQP
jgi:coenzyme F420 hydrogenase subunit beta